jgi:peroxiredoxin
MAALSSGTVAPQLTLKDLSGKSVSLAGVLTNGPALVAFFKVGCPTCQFTLPFLQRLYETYGGSNFAFFGISQDSPGDTRQFMHHFGIKFPMLIDDHGYAASKAYGLTNVPTIFWINPDGKIHISSSGFSKNDLEKISSEAALATRNAAKPLFRPGEVVPAFKPG